MMHTLISSAIVAKPRGSHFRSGEGGHADLLGRGLRHLRFIVQRADDRKPQPRPWSAEAARQGDNAQKNAHAGQKRKCCARGDRTLEFNAVDAHGKSGAVGANHKHGAYNGYECDNAAAYGVHRCTVRAAIECS